MSDAIRCGQCRWFTDRDPYGYCELNPPVYVGPMACETQEWRQPIVFDTNGCSRGSPKSGSTITVRLTEEKMQPRRFEEET